MLMKVNKMRENGANWPIGELDNGPMSGTLRGKKFNRRGEAELTLRFFY